MESLFFNLNGKKFQKSRIAYKIERTDISQGMFFLYSKPAKKERVYTLDYIDKMAIFFIIKSGSAILRHRGREQILREGRIYLFCFNAGRADIVFNPKNEAFVLFAADFFLKNYLSQKPDNPADWIYYKVQNCFDINMLCSCAIDSEISYMSENIVNLNSSIPILSLKGEILALEILAHLLQTVKIDADGYALQELKLAQRAKETILKDIANPPKIKELAKLCQTNETKLKRVFKKVFGVTIYKYIQELRLNMAYRVLKEEGCTVAEAAKAVGYEHQGNFAKLFKEKYKIEPSLINKNPFVAKKY